MLWALVAAYTYSNLLDLAYFLPNDEVRSGSIFQPSLAEEDVPNNEQLLMVF
jgi:hypothetical protein